MPDVIDLCSDGSEEPADAPIQTHEVQKRRLGAYADDWPSSDDDDATLEERPAKKTRVDGITGVALRVSHIHEKTTWKGTLQSDPIDLSAPSPPEHLRAPDRYRPYGEETDDDTGTDINSMRQSDTYIMPPKLISQGTCALLAELKKSNVCESSQGRNEKTAKIASQGDGRRLFRADTDEWTHSNRSSETIIDLSEAEDNHDYESSGPAGPDAAQISRQEKSKPSKPKARQKKQLTDAERILHREETERRAKERERKSEADKERRRLAKEEKAREKKIAADLAEVNKSKMDKKITTPEMMLDLPMVLKVTSPGPQIISFMQKLGVEVHFKDHPIPNTIKWRRKVQARYDKHLDHWVPISPRIEDEKTVMCILTAKEFVDLSTASPSSSFAGDDIIAHLKKLRTTYEGYSTLYLIEGLEAWKRKNRNHRNRRWEQEVLHGHGGAPNSTQASGRRKVAIPEYVDEEKIEDQLLRLQIHNVLIHHTATPLETAEWVGVFTQHISTIPYRAQRMNLDAGFCMDVGQVKTGNDPKDTYTRMLQEIVRVTPPIAYGVAGAYPDVRALVEALQTGGTETLVDIKKSANRNGTVTDARLGPAISKRLFKIFTGRDPTSTDV
ncbi:MAG: hypothetical protein M1817_005526 [Caeruleum heppii]|nr:MAG: hypothetical protein M1817_005526 [Caeruleum heppii]